MIKSIIHNVCVNRGTTDAEAQGMRSRLLYVAPLSLHFLVLPAGLMKIPHDAYETGEVTHISLSPFPYFLIY